MKRNSEGARLQTTPKFLTWRVTYINALQSRQDPPSHLSREVIRSKYVHHFVNLNYSNPLCYVEANKENGVWMKLPH